MCDMKLMLQRLLGIRAGNKMMNRRYAHCSVFLNGYVYVIGGFNNKDAEDVSPNTINS